MDYEHQIVSIVLSHCRYSLKSGKAHNVEYDHQALEKHILDKFIHGKPMILSDIPQVIYRKDIYTTVTFDAVRRKIPQVSHTCIRCAMIFLPMFTSSIFVKIPNLVRTHHFYVTRHRQYYVVS